MPSSMISISIEGIEEVIARFRAGEIQAITELTVAMGQSVALLKKDAEVYPPETAANAPPPPYYIRGLGTQYKTYNRRESEHLKDNWHSMGRIESRGVIGKVSNTMTSYAPWVHGIRTQALFHAQRGWRTIAEILDNNRTAIESRFGQAAQRLARFLNGGTP